MLYSYLNDFTFVLLAMRFKCMDRESMRIPSLRQNMGMSASIPYIELAYIINAKLISKLDNNRFTVYKHRISRPNIRIYYSALENIIIIIIYIEKKMVEYELVNLH